jgi:succinoglycan biosynthesis transport protein ExoP
MNDEGSYVRSTSGLDLLFVLFKWKWSLITVIGLTLLGTVIWLFLVREDLYVTEAKLLVKLGTEQAPPSTVIGQSPLAVGYFSADVKSEIDILGSGELISQLVDQFEMDKPRPAPPPVGLLATVKFRAKSVMRSVEDWMDEIMIKAGFRERLSPREQTVATLQQSLSVTAVEGSNVIVAGLAVPFRKDSSVVLNALLDNYLKFRLQVYRDRGNEFFRKEAGDRADQLERAEAELQDFERNSNITNLAKQKDLLLDEISVAERARDDAALAYNEAKSKVDRLNSERKQSHPNFAALGGVDASVYQRGLLTQMAELESKRQELSLTELESSDKMRGNREQYQANVEMLAANLSSVMAEKASDLAQRSEVLSKLGPQLDALNGSEMTWLDLKRKVSDLDTDYGFYRRKLEESGASTAALEQVKAGNVFVIQPAMDPIKPAGMRKILLLGIALLVGVCAALVFVAVGEFFDHRIYLPGQLERHLAVPVFGEIPLQRNRRLRELLGDSLLATKVAGSNITHADS